MEGIFPASAFQGWGSKRTSLPMVSSTRCYADFLHNFEFFAGARKRAAGKGEQRTGLAHQGFALCCLPLTSGHKETFGNLDSQPGSQVECLPCNCISGHSVAMSKVWFKEEKKNHKFVGTRGVRMGPLGSENTLFKCCLFVFFSDVINPLIFSVHEWGKEREGEREVVGREMGIEK